MISILSRIGKVGTHSDTLFGTENLDLAGNPLNVTMPYNEKLTDGIREMISLTHKNVGEKRMFGGICFMVNDKMCLGVEQERLMVRLDPANYDEVIEKEGCKPMDFTGKVMKGFVFVNIVASRKPRFFAKCKCHETKKILVIA